MGRWRMVNSWGESRRLVKAGDSAGPGPRVFNRLRGQDWHFVAEYPTVAHHEKNCNMIDMDPALDNLRGNSMRVTV